MARYGCRSPNDPSVVTTIRRVAWAALGSPFNVVAPFGIFALQPGRMFGPTATLSGRCGTPMPAPGGRTSSQRVGHSEAKNRQAGHRDRSLVFGTRPQLTRSETDTARVNLSALSSNQL